MTTSTILNVTPVHPPQSAAPVHAVSNEGVWQSSAGAAFVAAKTEAAAMVAATTPVPSRTTADTSSDLALADLRAQVGNLRSDLKSVRATVELEMKKQQNAGDTSDAAVPFQSSEAAETLRGAVDWLCEELSAFDEEARRLRTELAPRSGKAERIVNDKRDLHRTQSNKHTKQENMAGQADAITRVMHTAVRHHRRVYGKVLDSVDQAFHLLDRDTNGTLDKAEFTQAVKRLGLGLTPKQIEECVEQIDTNGDGLISLSEFKQALEQRYFQETVMDDSSPRRGGQANTVVRSRSEARVGEGSSQMLGSRTPRPRSVGPGGRERIDPRLDIRSIHVGSAPGSNSDSLFVDGLRNTRQRSRGGSPRADSPGGGSNPSSHPPSRQNSRPNSPVRGGGAEQDSLEQPRRFHNLPNEGNGATPRQTSRGTLNSTGAASGGARPAPRVRGNDSTASSSLNGISLRKGTSWRERQQQTMFQQQLQQQRSGRRGGDRTLSARGPAEGQMHRPGTWSPGVGNWSPARPSQAANQQATLPVSPQFQIAQQQSWPRVAAA